MSIATRRFPTVLLLALGAITAAAGCKSNEGDGDFDRDEGPSSRVTLDALSTPARATVERLTAGGRIEKIDKEVEDGVLLYDVEANVNGKHVEWAVADSNGEVLGTETSIEYGELPAAVREAAEKYFDHGQALKAMKGVERGKTSYELEGLRAGKKVEATFDSAGKKEE